MCYFALVCASHIFVNNSYSNASLRLIFLLFYSRATFLGVFMAFFSCGSIGSHLLNLLVIPAQWLPTTILGLLSALGSISAFFLPETSGLQSLPEKWEDIKEIEKTPRKSYLIFNLPKLNGLKSVLGLHWKLLYNISMAEIKS